MKNSAVLPGLAVAAVLFCGAPVRAQQADMTFFVSSEGSGKGADLGGLAGADSLCQKLAAAAGASAKTFHAYLSTQGADGINARDRIGAGPWQNAKGEVIAKDVAELHGNNRLAKQTALTETGAIVNGRGDIPNTHDVLTGTMPDGSAPAGAADQTCGNWSKSGPEGAAIVGHSDRTGLDTTPEAVSWNSSHLTRGGCSQEALKSTGGSGRLYCFAVK